MANKFKLDSNFLRLYDGISPDWGFKSGPNSIGELTYTRTYSRIKEDGSNETWLDTVTRVVEGSYTIQKNHCLNEGREWDDMKAQMSAQEMFDRMFNMKFLPPGRGLWMMGTEYVTERNDSAPLYNCAFISTEELQEGSAYPFSYLMDMSMLGVGVGFDTLGAGAPVYAPLKDDVITWNIPDTREGWVKATKMLIDSYLHPDMPVMNFDYSVIREAGAPIKGFGGVASGPAPLIKLHERIRMVLDEAAHHGKWTSRDIVDIQNMIGACVVAGNVRRSAEIALGGIDDEEFLNLKNYEKYPERAEWGWASNNTLVVRDGDTPDYTALAERISDNGEPGLFFLDVARKYGRLIDPPDYADEKAKGTNPCAEIILESGEFCNLVEVFPSRCTDIVDFLRTIKFAYLYAKSVTLMNTHDPRVNEVQQRNRRIGASVSGVVQFLHHNSKEVLEQWLRAGYGYINNLDAKYSDWLGIPESIRKTTVKPSGTVSLLAGVTPGVHYPVADYYIRRIRLQANHPLVADLKGAGYHVEDDKYSDNTVVVSMPVKGEGLKTETEASVFDKVDVAIFMAKYWADNAVSNTITFRPDETEYMETVLQQIDGNLKTVSFLPIRENVYEQAPYEAITKERYEEMVVGLKKIDFSGGSDGEMEKFCTTDVCEVDFGEVEEIDELV